MDVIIFGGQSNMQGEGDRHVPGVIEYAYEYKYLDDVIVPLQNPVGEDILYDGTRGRVYMSSEDTTWVEDHVLGSACFGNASLVPKFCEAYIEATGKEVLAVPVAKGSTFIATWMPGEFAYTILVRKVQAALDKLTAEGQKIEHIFFVWLQGECDAIVGKTKAYYKEQIAILNEALKKDLQIEKFGVIRVGRFTNDARDLEIIGAQDEICEENKDFLMLTTIGTELNAQPEYMNPNCAGHFGTKGLEKLGRVAGKKLGESI